MGEGAGEVFLTISLDRATTSPVTVRYETSDGTARAGLDFVATSATTTVPASHTSTTVTVPILDDSLDELNETFTVTLSDPSGQSFVSSDRFSIIIFDNDDPPSLTAGPGAQVVEGDGGAVVIVAVPVTLLVISSLPVNIIYSTSDGTATVQDNDYTGVSSGTLTIEPGNVTGTALVSVTGDSRFEMAEWFALTLQNATTTSIDETLAITEATVTVVIQNDDAPPSVSVVSEVRITEGEAASALTIHVPVTLSAVSGLPVTVEYETSDGTATVLDGDWTGRTGQTNGTAMIERHEDERGQVGVPAAETPAETDLARRTRAEQYLWMNTGTPTPNRLAKTMSNADRTSRPSRVCGSSECSAGPSPTPQDRTLGRHPPPGRWPHT